MSTNAQKRSLIDEWIPSDWGWFGTWMLLLAAGNGLINARGPVWFVVHLGTILVGAALAFRALAAQEKREHPE